MVQEASAGAEQLLVAKLHHLQQWGSSVPQSKVLHLLELHIQGLLTPGSPSCSDLRALIPGWEQLGTTAPGHSS